MARHKEGKVETYFVEQVELYGGITRKAQWIGRRGCPDRFWAFPPTPTPTWKALSEGKVLPTRCGFAEIKSPDGRLDPHQEREIKRLRTAAVVVVVLSSFEDVDDFIRREVA